LKVFLDTNVLVSAFATRGLCADVLRYVLAEHELATSEIVLAELQRILRERIHLPATAVTSILELLREQVVAPAPTAPSTLDIRDPDDAWVLASALTAGADVLVTGDKDLLEIREPAGIFITNPRGFWNWARSRR
jgi:putative PIN family toxin of toxin-antitoxin system